MGAGEHGSPWGNSRRFFERTSRLAAITLPAGTGPTMETRREEWIPTRASLLGRIRNPEDQSGWAEFFRRYRGFIGTLARKRGLTEVEAEDFTQETMLSLFKTMRRFRYDPRRCSFKSWLGRLVAARAVDFLRREPVHAMPPPAGPFGDGSRTATRERLPDPASLEADAAWEADWRQNVVALALGRLKETTKPLHYQVFHLHAIKGRSARQVARALGISVGQVYLVKHRVTRTFKRLVTVVRAEEEREEAGAVNGRARVEA
jgi:RNA polymerase sigma-70 factor (ECF subfamily)